MSVQDARKELALLVNSQYPIIYLETWEETRATEILGLVAQDLAVPFYIWTITGGLFRAGGAHIYNTQEPIQVLAEISGMEGDALFLLKDFHKHLDDSVIVRKLRDLTQLFRRARRSILISSPIVNLPVELEKDTARFLLGLPEDSEMNQLVVATVRDLLEKYRFQNLLAQDQLPEVVRSLRGLTRDEARRVLTQAILEDSRFDLGTLDRIREAKNGLIKDQGVLEFLEPQVGLEAVGGLARLKAWLGKRRGALTPEAARFGLELPKGILVTGVQGCGKSLCAKAVAREWNMQLLKFDCSNLFEKYIGESEKNLRRSLHVAEAVAPAVLWIDEIEKMFPHSALSAEADGGLSVRIFGSFLTWMQEKKAPVFVVATSNDISALPPELLRKGRFDEIFFVDLPELEERKTIFGIHLARRKQDPAKFDLARLAAAAEGFSGAEIEQAVTSALYAAFSQKAPLSTEVVLKEIQSTYPLSVTMKERVAALRDWARERTVPAN
jgi:SpoVK/Ycf46/Vps4 family AAA+-type ATPase